MSNIGRIFITGDTHGHIDIEKLSTKNFRIGKELNKDDYVIITGDFGLIWYDKTNTKEYKKQQNLLKWLSDKPFTTLFIDGNHENFNVLNSYPIEKWNGGYVHKITDSVIHLMRGQVFNINGKRIFTMGGAESTDKVYRVENKSWWKEEYPNATEMNDGLDNLAVNYNHVDIILTHDCPMFIQSDLRGWCTLESYSLNKYLQYLYETIEFKHWLFGHHHVDRKDFNTGDSRLIPIFKNILEI